MPIRLYVEEVEIIRVLRSIRQIDAGPVLIVGQQLQIEIVLSLERLVEHLRADFEVLVDDRSIAPHERANLRWLAGDLRWRGCRSITGWRSRR
jgi:hypothetical protein